MALDKPAAEEFLPLARVSQWAARSAFSVGGKPNDKFSAPK